MPEATGPGPWRASGPRTKSGAGQTMHAASPTRRKQEPGGAGIKALGKPDARRRRPGFRGRGILSGWPPWTSGGSSAPAGPHRGSNRLVFAVSRGWPGGLSSCACAGDRAGEQPTSRLTLSAAYLLPGLRAWVTLRALASGLPPVQAGSGLALTAHRRARRCRLASPGAVVSPPANAQARPQRGQPPEHGISPAHQITPLPAGIPAGLWRCRGLGWSSWTWIWIWISAMTCECGPW